MVRFKGDAGGQGEMTLRNDRRRGLLVGALAAAVAGCATPVAQIDGGQLAFSDAVEATAVMQPFHGSHVRGALQVAPLGGGVRITGTITGLPRGGDFGFHVKEVGDCSTPEASGAILNPLRTRHGQPAVGEYMLGDLPNIDASPAGTAQLNLQVAGLTLGGGGHGDIAGRSLVIHEGADDYSSQPEGNAGRRIACGVITVTNPPPEV